MKKFIASLIILVMVIGICSCSGGKPDTAETGKQQNTSAASGSKTEETKNPENPGKTTEAAAQTEAVTSDQPGDTEPAPIVGSEGLEIRVYDDGCEVRDIGTFSGTELVIPSHVDGIPVTSIDEDALTNDTMISLFIPWTVRSVGEDAVSSSQNLETVTFCEGLLGVGEGSFGSCPKLKSIELPSTLERIANSAFRECTALTEVVLNSNAAIGHNAFTGCPSLKKVTLKGSGSIAYSLGKSAFEGDAALEEIKLTEGLETIGAFCFSGCTSLGTVYLPASLTKIEASAFYNVGSLKINYAGTEEQWNAINVANGNEALASAEITYNFK